jgi:hypothetical protein
MQVFIRTMEMHKTSTRSFSPEMPFGALRAAVEEAKRMVMASDAATMLQADVFFRNGTATRTTYRCWRDERGDFHEQTLV